MINLGFFNHKIVLALNLILTFLAPAGDLSSQKSLSFGLPIRKYPSLRSVVKKVLTIVSFGSLITLVFYQVTLISSLAPFCVSSGNIWLRCYSLFF